MISEFRLLFADYSEMMEHLQSLSIVDGSMRRRSLAWPWRHSSGIWTCLASVALSGSLRLLELAGVATRSSYRLWSSAG